MIAKSIVLNRDCQLNTTPPTAVLPSVGLSPQNLPVIEFDLRTDASQLFSTCRLHPCQI